MLNTTLIYFFFFGLKRNIKGQKIKNKKFEDCYYKMMSRKDGLFSVLVCFKSCLYLPELFLSFFFPYNLYPCRVDSWREVEKCRLLDIISVGGHHLLEKLYRFHGESCHLSIIPLKGSHLFRIVESTYRKKKKSLLNWVWNFK